MNPPLRVDVWSDVACPWCYIGKRKLEMGVAEFGGEVEVAYHSFLLAPDAPLESRESSAEYLAARLGMSPEQVQQMLDRVTGVAAEVGLRYDLASVQRTNTRRAHELLHLAGERGVQSQLLERLMRAHFVEGRHIGRVDELIGLSAEVGLDPDEVGDALADGRYAGAVDADVAQARAYGIGGVPFFVIDGRLGVSGAQPPEVLAGALAQAAASREGA